MAFFKFRLPGSRTGDDASAASPHTESVESLRRRARHRLIGAAVLVLAAVVGFPLLFDTQPRPVAVDIPIDIPDRHKVKPLTLPAAKEAAKGTAAAPASSSQVAAPASLDPREEIVAAPGAGAATKSDKKPADVGVERASSAIEKEATAAKAPPRAEARTPPRDKAEARPESKPESKSPDDGARARALLEGREADKPAAADKGRFVVQVGAFSEVAKARETRLKVEKAGLKTYTQVVETGEGKRIRVRVGPFATRAEADKAAARIKGLQLQAAVLTL